MQPSSAFANFAVSVRFIRQHTMVSHLSRITTASRNRNFVRERKVPNGNLIYETASKLTSW